MPARPVEWVLVVYYGPEAHRATYGRQVRSNRYTKDYIQLSRKKEFLDAVKKLLAANASVAGSVPLTYEWPGGNAPGAIYHSSDRPHLKWETSLGAPQVWKMALAPTESTAETIPGNPTHLDFAAAENELATLSKRGAGQPYLLAVKLRDESRTLHLRVYLTNPSRDYAWADIELAPRDIQTLADKTSQRSALAWSVFQSGGAAPASRIGDILTELIASNSPAPVVDALDEETGRAFLDYLQQPGYGLFFDSALNHDAWSVPEPLPEQITDSVDDLVELLEPRFPIDPVADAITETLDVSAEETDAFREQISNENYEIADSHATVKTRGSAQRAFAEAVKRNYQFRCAITGIENRDFLVAAHIVPWSEDQSIRLDPSNGICLSLLVDRAYEKGYLLIGDDFTIDIDWNKVGDDEELRGQLASYEGKKLDTPRVGEPKPEYLLRRRTLVVPKE